MQHHYYGQFQPDGEISTDELRINESTNDSTAYDAGSMSNESSHAPFQQQFLASHEDGTSANTSNLTNWANDVADRRDAMSEIHRAAYDDEIRHMQFDFTGSSNSNNMEAAQERQMYPSRDSHETVLTSQELSDGIAAILSGGSFHFGPSNLSGATSLSGRHASSLPEIQPSYGGQGTLPNLAKTSPSLRSQTSSFHSDPTSLRAPIEAESSGSHTQAGTLDRRCSTCGIRDSPEWRKGFDGHKTLCNACGLRHSRNVNRARRKEEMGRIAGEVAANGGVVPEHLRMNKLADDFRRRKRSKSASSSAASNLQQSFTSFDVSSPEVQRSLEPISLFSSDANSAGGQSSFQPPAQRPQTSNPSDVRSPQGSNN